ncbi:hypothetical protein PPRY_a0990 [Pseudoalteromonas prydzensis ACAM 620]|nr:hypothetical protein [Pseudoalteromonas prydzensis ACAM 620]
MPPAIQTIKHLAISIKKPTNLIAQIGGFFRVFKSTNLKT